MIEENTEEYTTTKQSYVMVAQNKVLIKDVRFLDIKEDLYGRDVMVFEYQGKTYESNVFL